MYYKLLNKTIITSAMLALIGFNINQGFAQEIVFEDNDIDISLPMPENTPPVIVEDDIIPLDKEGLIVPQPAHADTQKPTAQEPKKEGAEAADAVKNKPVEAVQKDAPTPDDFAIGDDFILPPARENVDSASPKDAPKATQKAADKALPQNAPKANAAERPAPKARPANNLPKAPANGNQNARPKPQSAQPKAPTNRANAQNGNQNDLKFGDSVLAQTNNELFNKMSDIEKQTTLLTLELKREKILNEVEAAKAVRQHAEQEKQAMEEAKKRQEEEWKKEQEAKVFREQALLKQKEIELEKVKQRKALTAYMNSMLEQKQMWVDENAKLYEEIERLRKANEEVRTSYKKDIDRLALQTSELKEKAENAKASHDRIVASLTAQNAQLKKRIEADAEAARRGGQNPFSGSAAEGGDGNVSSSADTLIKPINISKEYAIMDITGKGDELFVKLINKAGDSFLAKVGTVLQTGHMVEVITPNYVQFDRNGLKDFLYTSASALEAEPNNLGAAGQLPQTAPVTQPKVNIIGEDSIPSVADSMFVK